MERDVTGSEQALWDVVSAAPLYSQLAGVLAGFAFIGVTLLLAGDLGASEEAALHARNAISEFFLAFLVLAVAAFEWGAVAGEPAGRLEYVRADAAAMFATISLSIGAVQMVAGICHLVRKEQVARIAEREKAPDPTEVETPPVHHGEAVWRTFVSGYYLVASLVMYQIAITAVDVISRGYQNEEARSSSWGFVACLAVTAAVFAWSTPRLKPVGQRLLWHLQSPSPSRRFGWGWLLAKASYRRVVGGVLIFGVVGFNLALAADPSSSFSRTGQWNGIGPALYVASIVLSVAGTLCILVLQGWLVVAAYSPNDGD